MKLGWKQTLAAGILFSQFSLATESPTPPNVILLTLDGVRWREVFHGVDPLLGPELMTKSKKTPIFTYLNGELSKDGFLFGDKLRGEEMIVGNKSMLSLPGYQTLMTGAAQPCFSNACGRVRVETLQERISRELDLSQSEVATISSWNKIALAVEHEHRTTFTNGGLEPLFDGSEDSEVEEINTAQMKDVPPWPDARYDVYTFRHALRYLKEHQPRFLFISLDDSDERGHRNEYSKYVETLKQYDQWIKTLVTTLKGMGAYGKATTLIVTADHGRGNGSQWTDHSSGVPESKDVWLYIRGPGTLAAKKGRAPAAARKAPSSLLHVRPTIEALFGLAPQAPSKVIGGAVLTRADFKKFHGTSKPRKRSHPSNSLVDSLAIKKLLFDLTKLPYTPAPTDQNRSDEYQSLRQSSGGHSWQSGHLDPK